MSTSHAAHGERQAKVAPPCNDGSHLDSAPPKGASSPCEPSAAPKRAPLPVASSGRLDRDIISKGVAKNFSEFRGCYDSGRRSDVALKGRVSVRFVIDEKGRVSGAEDAGSDLPNDEVVACIVRGFGHLQFPPPKGGIVSLIYPLRFAPAQ